MDEDDYEDLKHEDDHLWTIKVDHNLRDLQSLGPHRTWIQKLNIMCDISDPSFLQYVDHVKEVKIFGPNVTRVDYLPELKGVETLEIRETNVQSITGLSKMPLLKKVKIHNNEQLTDLGTAINSDSIKSFVVTASLIKMFPEIQFTLCTNFGYAVGIVKRLSEFLPRMHLPRVNTFWFDNHQIEDIQGFNAFPSLKKICLANNRITTLDGFNQLSNVESIDVVRNPIIDINGVLKLRKLKLLQIDERSQQLLPRNFINRVTVDTKSSITPVTPQYIMQRRG